MILGKKTIVFIIVIILKQICSFSGHVHTHDLIYSLYQTENNYIKGNNNRVELKLKTQLSRNFIPSCILNDRDYQTIPISKVSFLVRSTSNPLDLLEQLDLKARRSAGISGFHRFRRS